MALMQDNVVKLSSGIHFVSGIDTDAGKTVCTGWLARELLRCGRRVATMKLVQTGCGDYSPDIRLHRRLMGVTLPEDEEGITGTFHLPGVTSSGSQNRWPTDRSRSFD